MKRIIAAFLSILLLILSACGKAPAATGTGTVLPADTAGSAEAVPTTEKKIGLAYLSESEQEVARRVGDDWNVVAEYVTQGKSGERLRECFAGMAESEGLLDPEVQGEGSRYLIIYLSDPEDQECLAELASLGLAPGYHVEKGIGTQDYLVQVKKEVTEKLNALQDKVKKGMAGSEERELINRYKPRNPSVDWAFGRVVIEVVIKTPWYSIGENWSEEDMYKDLEHCRDLFRKLIGDYDVVSFCYGV